LSDPDEAKRHFGIDHVEQYSANARSDIFAMQFIQNHTVEFTRRKFSIVIVLGLLFFIGCGRVAIKPSSKDSFKTPLARIHYTIQVGAFSNIENAIRFTEKLRRQDIDAYHFLHPSGLYKVRFGNFASKTAAVQRATALVQRGIIHNFYIVPPENYSNSSLRNSIVRTADSFLGVPYRWGGESVEEGFDCSGFTMTVYRLNGLDLPRSSLSQWHTGRTVGKNDLKKGNLVFFRTAGNGRISHVGIYAGNGQFIHAPGKGKKVRKSSLDSRYYKIRYAGAKTYF
jgi:gamma-D-glutamyl-L-lysine dipeptidyl-peptidase